MDISEILIRINNHKNLNTIESVCEKLSFSLSEIKSKSRKRETVIRRNIVMFILRTKNITLVEIGNFFNKHHTSVIHAVKSIYIWIKTKDELFLSVIDGLNKEAKFVLSQSGIVNN